ncbi:MAG: thiamine diphosphokinase [Veillonellaceae bacterium]|mgnify:CR=1 FL=1|nr:thiamine diphosphokinase [Veillonellaceae bacterium]
MEIVTPKGRFCWADTPSAPLVLLVGGGRRPSSKWLRAMAENSSVWAIDRGIDICCMASVMPELLIGDADSASPLAWEWGQSLEATTIRHPRDKDATDLQLALTELGAKKPGAAVLLTGGLGGRLDHAVSNVFSLQDAGHAGVQVLGLADEKEALFFVAGGQQFTAQFPLRLLAPKVVSLLPLSPVCEAVISRGVHWPLDRATLTMGRPAGICNRLAAGSKQIDVTLENGWLGVYFCWREASL